MLLCVQLFNYLGRTIGEQMDNINFKLVFRLHCELLGFHKCVGFLKINEGKIFNREIVYYIVAFLATFFGNSMDGDSAFNNFRQNSVKRG